MIKKIIVLLAFSFFLGGCSLLPQKAGIEIMSNISAKVFIDNKDAGTTPYKNTSLKPGEVEVRMVTDKGEWKRTVELKNNVNTVINWGFGDDEKQSGGYVLTMEKTGNSQKAGLLVNCDPDKASVQIDNETKGFSPTKIDDIGEGDRQLTISYPGYQSINVFVKAINGYTLVIEANLAKEKAPEPKVQEELIPSLAPLQNLKKAVIKQTETGWLRVRAEANANSAEVAKVKPNESYTVAEENGDWIKIQIDTTKSGWVSAKYVEIQK